MADSAGDLPKTVREKQCQRSLEGSQEDLRAGVCNHLECGLTFTESYSGNLQRKPVYSAMDTYLDWTRQLPGTVLSALCLNKFNIDLDSGSLTKN